LRRTVVLRRHSRPEPALGFRRWWSSLLSWRVLGSHTAALDLLRAPARYSRHRGTGARAAAQCVHPRREANGGLFHAARLSVGARSSQSLAPGTAGCILHRPATVAYRSLPPPSPELA